MGGELRIDNALFCVQKQFEYKQINSGLSDVSYMGVLVSSTIRTAVRQYCDTIRCFPLKSSG